MRTARIVFTINRNLVHGYSKLHSVLSIVVVDEIRFKLDEFSDKWSKDELIASIRESINKPIPPSPLDE